MVNKQEVTIGQAYPSVSYLMVDTSDNMTRMYPQALLKQFPIQPKPSWSKFDINAQFNTEANWYFDTPTNIGIQPNQIDLLRTMCHELIHGLGFVSSWTEDLYEHFSPFVDNLAPFLTPMLLQPPQQIDTTQLSNTATPEPFWGFVEYPMDKFIQFQTSNLSSTTRYLSSWGDGNVLFRSLFDMINSWVMSDYFNASQRIYQACTSAQAVTFTTPSVQMILETSLNPFTDGSSLSHVDNATYANSPDYLMTYTTKAGISIATLNNQFPAGPIGPLLFRAMQAIGYQGTKQYLLLQSLSPNNTCRPKLIYWSPDRPLVGTTGNPSASVSIVPTGPARSPTASATRSGSATSSPSFSFRFCIALSSLILLVSF
ncbi:hypothetical protein DM01DRAFT_302262 [Hesseltinella vesiculosa]|uniref:Sequence orphan n=1 Tax=Hesseltinella vesiculosa TaxID=101127 RepID=A0A1X2GRP0_9FUNG|nr:hypothetical protein DM01DRAFT_302262 [Hesseltinella vesiculosa]